MANMQEMEKALEKMQAQIEMLSTALNDANARLAGQTKTPSKFYAKRPQKFWTKVSRYVDGKYIMATPEIPAVVVFPDHIKVPVKDDGVTPLDGTLAEYVSKTPPVEKAAKPFAEIRRGPKDRTNQGGESEDGKRPSDTDPAEQ